MVFVLSVPIVMPYLPYTQFLILSAMTHPAIKERQEANAINQVVPNRSAKNKFICKFSYVRE